jgi:phosphoribosylformylglycinamidine synthase
LVAIAEMALAGRRGVKLDTDMGDLPPHRFWFGEDQARYVVSVPGDGLETLLRAAEDAGLPAKALGTAGGEALTLGDEPPLPLEALRSTYERWLPAFMDGGREK